MKNQEPTDEQINDYLVGNPHESWFTAREKLRDKAYSEDYKKPEGMTWGEYWKSF